MPTQDVILSDIDPADRGAIEAMLRADGVRLAEDLLPVERWALACPALPSCGLALTEAERVQDEIVGAIAARLRRWGLAGERLSIRITGCPNGCARPYTGDIGIVGRVPGFYSLYVGGDFEGTRLNQPLADRLDIAGMADALDPLFGRFASDGCAAKASAISATGSALPPCAIRSSRAEPGPPDGLSAGVVSTHCHLRKIVPPIVLRNVPFGDGYIRVRLNSVILPWSGAMSAHLTPTPYCRIAWAASTVTWSSLGWLHLTPRQRAARAAFSVALGRIAADVLA